MGYYPKIPLKRVVRDVAASTISTASWVSFVATMPDDSYNAEFFNSTGQLLEIGIGANTASVTVIQYYIIPGGQSGQVGTLINKGQNLFLRAVDGNATAGLVVANFLR